ncbi:Crp/Fnr family transcriptional regulator [Ferruginibacter yonginensis]|uniref:Crp/Fnr family transcriptional regulator n=1 Tax=Ferruginibacter yonginensis TaxID=1310416 RepID=A0ABV8QTT4_9BACT
MSTNLIIQNIEKHIRLTEAEQQYFVSLLVEKNLKRKQLILAEGDVCKYSTFVVTGCLRGYTIDKNGFEHVLNFAPTNWWIADMYSLLSQKPGILHIEALENSTVLMLSKEDHLNLYEKIPAFERYFRILIENALVALQQRMIDSMSLTADERYQKFCTTYPSLINSLPQKQIASFIGVTPEFLSKLRGQQIKKKI